MAASKLAESAERSSAAAARAAQDPDAVAPALVTMMPGAERVSPRTEGVGEPRQDVVEQLAVATAVAASMQDADEPMSGQAAALAPPAEGVEPQATEPAAAGGGADMVLPLVAGGTTAIGTAADAIAAAQAVTHPRVD